MKIFQCGNCAHPLFFENYSCENCGHLSGYRDTDRMMLTFNPTNFTLISDREKFEYKYCKNNQYQVCNWLIDKYAPSDYCSACQLNRTIPNLTDTDNFQKWKNLEIAKHRLIYQLQKLNLSLVSKMDNNRGLCFDFIAKGADPNIMTGHADGVITILLKEADSVLREQIRKQLSEPYRTLIGHLRHEVGHYFWQHLVFEDFNALSRFRTIFGNEELDYKQALENYYQYGAPADWKNSFISKYATAHPWEDWAETWAHYLHLMDMAETAHFFGLEICPATWSNDIKTEIDPYTIQDFKTIVDICIPLSFTVNNINRAMGIPDVYPFAITPAVVQKMTFIHELLWQNNSSH